jgi:hypothetical protein
MARHTRVWSNSSKIPKAEPAAICTLALISRVSSSRTVAFRASTLAVLSKQILEAAGKRPEGSLLAAKQFLALGTRDAVDQALRRLASRGQLVKITRGRYALPVRSRFGTRPPAPELVIAHLKTELGEELVSSGVAAANALGLTTQMPVQQTFLSRTRSHKRYRFGKQEISLRQAPRWQFLLADRPAGQAIRALAWLGPDQAGAALPRLRQVLPAPEWDALLAVRAELPIWLVELLNEQEAEGRKPRT